MNNIEKMQLIKAQKSQLSEMVKEKMQEEMHIDVITLNDKEIPLTEQGIKDSRSIARQIGEWQKTLSPEAKDANLGLFIGIEETFETFNDYLISKYSGDKKIKWELSLNNTDYANDVKRIFMSRIYRHKAELIKRNKELGFYSPKAYTLYQEYNLKKAMRAYSHEANSRVNKIAEKKEIKSPLTDKDREWVRQIIKETYEKNIADLLPIYKTEANHILKLVADTEQGNF